MKTSTEIAQNAIDDLNKIEGRLNLSISEVLLLVIAKMAIAIYLHMNDK